MEDEEEELGETNPGKGSRKQDQTWTRRTGQDVGMSAELASAQWGVMMTRPMSSGLEAGGSVSPGIELMRRGVGRERGAQ